MKKAHVQFHRDGYGPTHPAVNVKVYKGLDYGLTMFKKEDHTIPERYTEDWIRENLSQSDINEWWNDACTDCFERAEQDAKEIFGSHVEVYSEGRSSGWLVVHHLPEFETWDAPMLAKWGKFAKYARITADDVPYQTVDLIYYNVFLYMEEKREQKIRDTMVPE